MGDFCDASMSVYSSCYDKILQTRWLKERKFVFSQFWKLSPRSRCLWGWFLVEAFPFIVASHPLAVSPHSLFPVDMWKGTQRCTVCLPLLVKTPVLSDKGRTLRISFNLNYLLKGLISK